jgi:hypothetical protein
MAQFTENRSPTYGFMEANVLSRDSQARNDSICTSETIDEEDRKNIRHNSDYLYGSSMEGVPVSPTTSPKYKPSNLVRDRQSNSSGTSLHSSSSSSSSIRTSASIYEDLTKDGLALLDDHTISFKLYTHWVSDDERVLCSVCSLAFSFFNRRHHCRACGEVVCASCSPDKALVAHSVEGIGGGLFGIQCRICKKCKKKCGKSAHDDINFRPHLTCSSSFFLSYRGLGKVFEE